MLWFSHFSMDGMSSFKYGAKALAHYVLMHRDVVSFEARHGPGHGPWAVLGYEEGGALLLHALRVMKAGEGLVPQPRVCSCTGCPGRLLQVWQLLVWEGKHAQAPVSVATKTRECPVLPPSLWLGAVQSLVRLLPAHLHPPPPLPSPPLPLAPSQITFVSWTWCAVSAPSCATALTSGAQTCSWTHWWRRASCCSWSRPGSPRQGWAGWQSM